MVKDLRHKQPSAVNGQGSHVGRQASEVGASRDLRKPLILSMLAHVVVLAALVILAPYFSSQRLMAPPAQMVQLVDLPSGGGAGTEVLPRETSQPPTVQPRPPAEPPKPEPPKAENPPEPKPEPKPDKIPPPKPPPQEPEMALPPPKANEPPKKEPPKREAKKPEPAERQVAPKKREPEPPARRPETMARMPSNTPPGAARRPGTEPGSGLALGTGSGMLSLDTANFPFTYYLRQVTGRIEENWIRPQGDLGRVIVYFKIKRDGSILEPQVHESSRNPTMDMLAAGAVKRSEPFPPLPIEFADDSLGIYLCFGMGSLCPGQKEG